MQSNKVAQPTKKDIAWQQKIEKQVKIGKAKLGNPSGKEQSFKLLNAPFNKE